MASTVKGSAGRFPFSPFRRFRGARGGYTLAELLAVMLILSVCAGASAAIYKRQSGGSPEEEAQKLARWLTNLATISNRTGRSFVIHCPGNAKLDRVEATWSSPMKKDIYTSAYGCVFNRYSGGYGGGSPDSHYSPQWSALVPALTIKITRGREEHYVIVSQRGRARTDKRPPPSEE